jgi:amino-acid N-acetyltransferase
MKTPADFVIEAFGGHIPTAEALGLDLATIYRWTYPKKRKGSNGSIPSRHQPTIIRAAQERGIDLPPERLVSLPASGEASDA